MCYVTDFVASLPPTHLFRRLLASDVPDIELPVNVPSNLEACIRQWEFIGKFFGEARKARAFRPAIMPLLAYLTYAKNAVPSLDRVCSILEPFCNADPEPRAYACLTSWLRELDVARQLPGQVTKNLLWDLTQGVDLIWQGRKIAVAHMGDKYIKTKQLKADSEVIYLYASSAGSGMHLVSPQEIAAKLFK